MQHLERPVAHVLVAFVALASASGCRTPRADAVTTTASTASPSLNVLLILTDDQGWPTLGSYGNTRVPTPHLDRLAAEGMRFSDAYVYPQCSPTRAALITGQHSARTRLWHVLPGYGFPWAPIIEPPFALNLPRASFTLMKGFKAAGYRTAYIGKWHVTANEDGHYDGLTEEGAKHFGVDVLSSHWSRPAEQAPGADKAVDRMTDETIAFLRANKERPFLAVLSHHTIHNPVVAPASKVAHHVARGAPETGAFNATYLASIQHLDDSVGRLLHEVDELGLRDRTMVLFLSDNGGVDVQFARGSLRSLDARTSLTVEEEQFPNAPLRGGKGDLHEGGIRVPFIVRWPGHVRPSSTSAHPVHVVDLMPTLFAAAGIKPEGRPVMDGQDLTPLLTETASLDDERALYWYSPLYDMSWGATPAAAIRKGRWKLIESFGDRFDDAGVYHAGHHVELYDLARDPPESENLAGKDPATAQRLLRELRTFVSDMGVPIPGSNPSFDARRAFERVGKDDLGWVKAAK